MNETALPPDAAAVLADAKKQLARLGGCALLIGVETYEGFPADKQLLAGRNDVLAYWKVCRRLGYRPEHIRVLTSPRLTVDDLVSAEQELGPELHPARTEGEIDARVRGWFAGEAPAVAPGEATREAILAGVKWLAAKLVFTVRLVGDGFKLEEELAALPGLLTYSGHGAQRDGALVLCPSDVGLGLENALSFDMLRALVDAGDDIRAAGTPHPADNLTAILDCCFAAAGPGSRALRVPSLTAAGSGEVSALGKEIASRVICASGRDEQSYQAMLGGHWHGAFTWALTVALEQWKTAPSGRFKKSTVTHQELLFRARMLLEALSFPQHPVLVDRIGNMPVFQHDSDANMDASAEPTAERQGVQIDPTVRPTVYLGYGTSTSTSATASISASASTSANTNGYISDMHYQPGMTKYVNWDVESKKRGQTLVLVLAYTPSSPSDPPRQTESGTDKWLCVGDEVNLCTTEERGNASYKWLANAADGGLLTYQNDTDGWIVESSTLPNGSLIHPGVTVVRFRSKRATGDKKYMHRQPANGGNNYLDLSVSSQIDGSIDWVISLPS